MTLEEIGACMGITRERVRQIEHSALKKLQENGGTEIAWIGQHTVALPECKRCGETFMRDYGRQIMCKACEPARKAKKKRSSASSLIEYRISAHLAQLSSARAAHA